MNKIIPIILSSVFFITSCEKKFLEVDQPGVVTVSATPDYDQLLNADDVNGYFSWPLIQLSDNFEYLPTRTPNGTTARLYTWQDQPYVNEDPGLWSMPYKTVYYANLVINEVMDSRGGSELEKEKLKAEGLLARAYAHFCIAQLYAKPYDPATAASDPGIPYVTSADMYANTPSRSTVKDCYDKMIKDIRDALPNLSDLHPVPYRGSKAAAYASLARIYLHMQDYDNTIDNANAALALKSDLLDMSPANAMAPVLLSNPENIYLRSNYELTHVLRTRLTASAAELFGATDNRERLLASKTSGLRIRQTNFGITVPETMLTKAEALVRKPSPDLGTALGIINTINAKRDRNHVDLNSTDPEEVLDWVLDERRRELIASPIRWFDSRRLAKEGKTPTVVRNLGTDIFTLTPDSKKYTLQIPQAVINFNPDMPLNER